MEHILSWQAMDAGVIGCQSGEQSQLLACQQPGMHSGRYQAMMTADAAHGMVT